MANHRNSQTWRVIVAATAALVVASCGGVAATPSAAGPTAAGTAATTSGSTPAPSSNASAPAGGSVTLQFPSWQQDEPGVSDWYKSMIAAFEAANSGVTISFTKVALADHVDKLTTEFAGGAPPQLVELPNSNVGQFVSHGWLHPLDDYLKSTDILQKWPTALQQSCVVDGKTYCIILNTYGDAWEYNSKLLSASGLSAPTTPDQYQAVVKAMTDPSKQQYGTCFPTLPGFNMTDMMSVFVIGAGGHWTTAGKPSANTPEVIQGLTWWNDVITAKATPLGNESGACRQLYQQGKVGSYFDGPWGQGFMAGAAADVKADLKAVPVPFPYNTGGAGFVIGVAEGVPADQQNLAWQFIQSMTTPDAQGQYAYDYGSAPLRQDAVLPGDMKTKFPYLDIWITASKNPVAWTPIGLESKQNEFIKAVSDAGQKMISQNVSPKDAADQLQQQLLTLAGS